ncbi:aryl-alcohol dehydrogenase-like predicted oxidoreductase [Pedobacter cryoconitis]|uniref:Aryl-alcohol dehydrogenase-like predicted oxidoreductase n=1 Tax=Pedobacter cryoconitis TaxID=188932 RepID=A0A7W8ZRD8_9SPHI|nr:aldo/keto reductase [Pedobacter cryoconitis]MBB5638447.1 aryl-alcohol dehydrogenase-like predicted oxidoreductase [Pedobacter cryoconitis]
MDLTNYRTLGKSGLKVSPLTLGAMTFGEDWGWGSTPADSEAILSKYIGLGGNIIDTANIYTKGHSEKIIGDYLKKTAIRRDQLVLSTKFYCNLYPGDPNSGGSSRKNIISSLENSLRRLQTDHIDLYWMHAFDPFTPIEETMSALHDLVRSGKVRYIAISDTPAWKIAQSQMIAQFRGWSAFAGLQIEYSLLERTVEGELIPMAQDLGLGVMPWSPLRGGVLSGKYTRANKGEKQSERTSLEGGAEFDERTYQIIDRLAEIAGEKETTPASVALAWVVSRPGVTSTLIGARTMEQLDQNLSSLSVVLSNDDIASLNELSAPVLNFPIPMILNRASHLAQAGTTVNDVPSLVISLAPQSIKEVY